MESFFQCYLDPSIPPEFIPTVSEGVLAWNRALAAAGWHEAIAVAAGSPRGIRLHRWLDAEAGVACYLFADGASAPACIRVGARADAKLAGAHAPLKYSVAVGLIAGAGPVQKIHRAVDEEFAVVCHFLADARNAPSCNRLD